MSDIKEKISVRDLRGFDYKVEVTHSPHLGFSMARYNGSIIADCQLGRILPPFTDDEREWERWNELFSEWTDEIKVNLIPKCQGYFNQLNK